ncbi:helix-turn-helix domain-containing protein [Pelagibacterium luteolum]|uniref:Helix-turn-helix n=1 Tax=Pelagibacterium luteolum TaxID=440168 RepID=A0A1G7YLV6_9HYPH|nr:helix-turn-helix domain-containing protein [Pelagibacterium luteolum]SDG97374.1 Helix-turn-helix [Pelagibacterium luteolum]
MKAGHDIPEALKEARARKGLSQRALGELTGLPQSHISKIESGAVDLQLSSLVQLARVLDLEVRLVPRKAVPAVDSVVRTTTPSVGTADQAQLHDSLRRVAEAANELTRLHLLPDAERLGDAAQLLQRVAIPPEDFTRVRKALDQLKPLQSLPFNTESYEAIAKRLNDPALQNALRNASHVLRNVRNNVVHKNTSDTRASVRPAYELNEEEDDA